MATLTIRNVPDELYELLKQAAERNRRSLNNEALVLLEKSLQIPQRTTQETEAWRLRMQAVREEAAVYVTSDEEVLEAIDRGRE